MTVTWMEKDGRPAGRCIVHQRHRGARAELPWALRPGLVYRGLLNSLQKGVLDGGVTVPLMLKPVARGATQRN